MPIKLCKKSVKEGLRESLKNEPIEALGGEILFYKSIATPRGCGVSYGKNRDNGIDVKTERLRQTLASGFK